MLRIMKEKTTTVAILVFVFALLTRTTDIVTSLLIFLFVSNLPIYSLSKKVMNTLAIINVIMSVIFGLYSFIMIVLRITTVIDSTLNTIRILSYISFATALLVTLLHLIMVIVYWAKEEKETINRLFTIALILPLVGILYQVADTFIVNALYNFFLNLEVNWTGFGTMSLSQTSIFGVAQTILLVYILARPHEKLEIME